MGNTHPPQAKQAIDSVLSDHFYGPINAAQAAIGLHIAMTTSAAQQSLAEYAQVQTVQSEPVLNSVH